MYKPKDKPTPVRRIITGHDENGLSYVSEDRIAPSVHTNPKRVGYCLTQLWMTDESPVCGYRVGS